MNNNQIKSKKSPAEQGKDEQNFQMIFVTNAENIAPLLEANQGFRDNLFLITFVVGDYRQEKLAEN